MGVFERSPVARPHHGQELIQFQVAVDGDCSAPKGLERRRMSNGDRSEEDAHRASTTPRLVNLCGSPQGPPTAPLSIYAVGVEKVQASRFATIASRRESASSFG